MRLARVLYEGSDRRLVVGPDDSFVDVTEDVEVFGEDFFGNGGMDFARDALAVRPRQSGFGQFPAKSFLSPIGRPHQILCIGLNYADHAAESAMTLPSEPVIFSKAPNSMCGPNDPVIRPRHAEKLDYEVELGVVIGSRAAYLDADAEVDACIAGYVLVNDYSEREFQLEREGQWIKGKSAATFNPTGPWLLSSDEVADPQNLNLWLEVNGERRQDASTADMVVGVRNLVRYVSQFMTLEPGDLINTGTPPGVALGMSPPAYLQDGDVVRSGISSLGEQTNEVVPYRDHHENRKHA